jgi:MFS family permease
MDTTTETAPDATRDGRRRTTARSPMPHLLAATVMVNMGFGAIFSLLAEIQDRFSFPTWGLGMIVGSSFVLALASQLLLARYADRGHARLLLIAGVGLSVVGLAWMGSVADSLVEFTLARGLVSVGEGALMPSSRRIVVVGDPDAAGRRLGQLGSAAFVGFLLGSPLAALMASAWGLRAPFAITALACAATLPGIIRLPASRGRTAPSGTGLLRSLARRRAVRASAALVMAEYVSIGVFDSVWARYLTDLGAGPVFVGVSLAVFAAPLALFAPLGGRLADRYGAFRVAVIALAVTVPCQALYGIAGTLPAVSMILLVHTLFEAAAIPASQAAVAEASPVEAVASGQALAATAGLAAAAATSAIAPVLYDTVGAGWLFAGSGLVMAALIVAATRRSPAGSPILRPRSLAPGLLPQPDLREGGLAAGR